MLKLSLPKEPYWLPLPGGAEVKVKPLVLAIYQAARSRAWVDAEKESGVTRDAEGKFPPDADYSLLNGLQNGYFAQHLARYGVLEWKGVGNDDGTPADCTADNAAQLMLIPAAGAMFLDEYTKNFSVVASEGNA
jgi:hypothetical protein